MPISKTLPLNATIRLRENRKMKDQANAICETLGTDLSAALRMFVRQIVFTKSIPLKMESGYTVEGEDLVLAVDREIDDDRANGRRRVHKTTASLLKDLKK